jgi:hypothetical protein
MIINARAVIRGKVLSVSTGYDEQQDRIYTYITVRVQEVLKGQITERRIVIKEEGGNLGDRGSIVFGTPNYTRGESVLLYLNTWNDGSLRTHQMFLGKFNILRDPKTGEQVVVRSLPDGEVKLLDEYPNLRPYQREGAITDRMELKAYRKLLRSRMEANVERIQAFEQTYYSNLPFLTQPPEFDETASKGSLHPNYTFITNPPVRWFEPDTGQPVLFSVNPDGAPASGLSDLDAAMSAWSTVPGCSMLVQRDPQTTGACAPNLSLNTIIFNGCDGRWGAGPSCSGILAVGGLSWGSETKVINGVTFRRARAGFVSFNPWCPNSPCGVQGDVTTQLVATHELGHALGLGHSWQPSHGGSPTTQQQQATMFYLAQFNRCASLVADDIAGITFMYPSSGGGGGTLTVTTSSLPSGTVGTPYSQNLAATGGTQPYNWTLVGTGLPGGLSLSSNGTISGTPNATGTFNFTVQVQDSTSATAQKALSITVNAAGTQYNADFITQVVPTTVTAGQSFSVTLQWQNNGTQTWNGSSGFRLGSQNPADNPTWGGDRVNLPGFVISPGQTLNLTFTAFAPSTAGTYNFQWQCFQEGVGFFGEMSTNVAVQVTSSGGGGGTNNSAFVSQSVSTSMTTGQTSNVSVTMQNTGTTTWIAGTYKLGSQNPADNTTWGLNRVNLASNVAPGGQATFTFVVAAPATAGTYNFQWRMLQDGVGYFGAASTNVAVNVTQSGGGGGSGPLNATFVSQSVPSVMTPGQTYSISVTMRNTGTTSWASTSGLSLSAQNPADNMTWNINKVSLNKFVGVNSQFAFVFSVRAPSTPGNYNFQWQMKGSSGFFGDKSTNVVVQVGSAGGTNNASFVSQSVSTSMTTGQSVSVSVTMQNTGTTTWAAGTYKLGSQNPADNTTWGLNRVNLASSVAPGGQATFNFTVVAPSTAGTYNFQWRMLQDGVGSFGATSTNVAVNVTQSGGGGGGGSNNAAFVSQSVSASMTTNQSVNVSVTMRNTGTTTWAAGTYKLGSQNPTDGMTWGLNRVNLASSVAPNGQATFTFTVTAPSAAGTYNFQWRMLQDGVGYFGAASTNVAVIVTGGATTPLVITTASLPNGSRNVAYNAQVSATGGAQPYTWSMTGAPSGITINSSTGVISGIGAAGTYNLQVTVKDANNTSTKKTFKILIK